MTILDVAALEKSLRRDFFRRKETILNGVSFRIEKGQTVGFLGRNGAGKSTTIKCVLDFIRPESGTINFFSQGLLTQEMRRQIGFLPEQPFFYEGLSGEEFLRRCGELSGLGAAEARERAHEYLCLLRLEKASSRPLRTYSKGMLQRVGLAQSLIHRPQFLILDEPMSGLDPDGRMLVAEILESEKRDGTTILFSTHLLDDIERLCSDVIVIDGGVVLFQGPLKNVMERESVSYRIVFRKKGVSGELTETGENLQETIDRLRSEGADIEFVGRKTLSLEEAFKGLVGDR